MQYSLYTIYHVKHPTKLLWICIPLSLFWHLTLQPLRLMLASVLVLQRSHFQSPPIAFCPCSTSLQPVVANIAPNWTNLDVALPHPLSIKPAKCEVDQADGSTWDIRITCRQTDRDSWPYSQILDVKNCEKIHHHSFPGLNVMTQHDLFLQSSSQWPQQHSHFGKNKIEQATNPIFLFFEWDKNDGRNILKTVFHQSSFWLLRRPQQLHVLGSSAVFSDGEHSSDSTQPC